MDQLANEVEKEKMKTIGTRNLLRSVAKEKDAKLQQIQVARLIQLVFTTACYKSYLLN